MNPRGAGIRLFHNRDDVEPLVEAIEDCYRLKVKDCGPLETPPGPRLNAAQLLSLLERTSGAHISLWMVDRILFYPKAGRIIGCAAVKAAVLSRAGLDPETLLKETLHEVGHLLGLHHCTGDCVMSFSASPEKTSGKPPTLCMRCSARLEALSAVGLSGGQGEKRP